MCKHIYVEIITSLYLGHMLEKKKRKKRRINNVTTTIRNTTTIQQFNTVHAKKYIQKNNTG